MDRTYRYYKEAFQGRLMPFAFVDLDRFDANVQSILSRAGQMPICVASKSVRCAALLKRIRAASPRFHSVLSFCVREAVYLSRQGLDNILVAYPTMGETAQTGLCAALRAGSRITLTVDCLEHVDHLERLGAQSGVCIPLCLDVDMSSDYPGLHFGVRRSGIRTVEQALALWEEIRHRSHVRLDGVMGYEAQIASLPERVPGRFFKNQVVKFLKTRSVGEVARRRAAVVQALKEAGCALRFVNGGGTGSVETTILEGSVTEVTVGSGFFSPALFDHFAGFRHAPAAMFALEITRRPAPGIFTCAGGGYIASGSGGPDRLPQPYLPEGAQLLPLEGAGEVQTPIRYAGPEPLRIGDPVFMRHGKAGELCERFNTLVLLSDGKVAGEVSTYRGDGCCFL